MTADIIDLCDRRPRLATLTDLYHHEDADEIRLAMVQALAAFRLDPNEYLDTEIGEIFDALDSVVSDLREQVSALPGLVVA